jgi:hypothetical protein
MDTSHNNPTRRELRIFGFTLGIMVGLVFGLLLPWLRERPWPLWPWGFASLMIAWALVHPASLRRLHGPWMKFAEGLQWLVTRLIMLLLFWVVILPIGLLRRLLGFDSMERRFDGERDSYRVLPGEQDENLMDRPY